MKILSSPEVLQYLNELVDILYEENYFGFEDSAIEYVEKLKSDIKKTLPYRPKHKAPHYFDRYGKDMYYVVFKKSKATQWYVFFTIYEEAGELTCLIRYISNNHVIARLLFN
ncbi:MAG: hypothetical protein LBB73_05780 [Dysgonamonadaceae bacterium]|jgi:hypothetical protein|nr:hypothetical protein [Dysgonamonadaceae bacterium]